MRIRDGTMSHYPITRTTDGVSHMTLLLDGGHIDDGDTGGSTTSSG